MAETAHHSSPGFQYMGGKMQKNGMRTKVERKTKKRGRKQSVSRKISRYLLGVLIPSLLLLIVISCLITARSISRLNDQLLHAQTDYAVSIVDDFFSGKLAAVSMFQENPDFQKYFQTVSVPEEINTYRNKDAVLRELDGALKRLSEEQVMQVWAADSRTDCYLMSTGEVVPADLKNTPWYATVSSGREAQVSKPYIDPGTGEAVISIAAPVFSDASEEITGFVGFDVLMSSLSQLLSQIKVGEKGYIELLSEDAVYIYSEDPAAMGKNVTELEISQDYKNKVQSSYNGLTDFTYGGTAYTAVFRNSETTGWLAVASLPTSEVNTTRNDLIVVLIALSLVILGVLILVLSLMIHRFMRPLTEISENMEEFSRGNLEVEIQVKGEDEIGRLAESVRSSVTALKAMIRDISHILGEISQGNVNIAVEGNYIGDFRFIGQALEQIIESLNNTLGQITLSAEQVSFGSEQVSMGAQALSQGATDQAGSVEELAINIGEISQKIAANAENAADANDRIYVVGREAVESNQRMERMQTAMQEIRNTSYEIKKIVKDIQEIAFQTNILALNASVEAARAGEHGRGFAVVAGDVRTLAAKSQEASKNTAVLIENSLKAVENGAVISDETASSMKKVMEGVRAVAAVIDGISVFSEEQAQSAAQIKESIEQISGVVQVNSATAQESAAASEELSAQAMLLKELMGRFRLKE